MDIASYLRDTGARFQNYERVFIHRSGELGDHKKVILIGSEKVAP